MSPLKLISSPFGMLATALPSAAARAVNNVAFAARAAAQADMRASFRQVSPAIIRANQVVKATSSNPVALVVLRNADPAFQRRLTVLGNVEEQGGTEDASDIGRKAFSVPAMASMKEGMPKNYVRRLLQRNNTYFLVMHGFNGIYRMTGRKRDPKLLVVLKKQLHYKPRIHWHESVGRAVANSMPFEFAVQIAAAAAGVNGRQSAETQ